jgi:hypothetical protein
MAQLVCMGATLTCSFGMAPGVLTVVPKGRPVLASGSPAATIADFAPMENVAAFGMCMSPANPQVIAATAAAQGVPTPMPCVPATSAPWAPGSPDTMINNVPAIDNTCTCQCLWGGVITISMPGQLTVTVDG